MARTETDILICGGGIAGLTAALAFGRAGFRVVLVSPAPPVTDGGADGSDLRSTAFLQPAKRLFDEIGLWPALAEGATPLDILRIVDTAGWPPAVREARAFQASDLGQASFGWNLLNWRVNAGLMQVLSEAADIDLRFGVSFVSMVTRDTEAIARLSDGNSVRARLIIAADGRNSAVRTAAGIDVETIRYGQKSLAFVASHPKPHENASTEIYNQGGPFTMVPLGDVNGRPASAVVWMNPGPRAVELMAMEVPDFEAEMTARSAEWLGPLTLEGPRRMWPIIAQRAKTLTAQRTAIMAEAAHVVPPIGAQGLNTSLNDLIALYELAKSASADLGSAKMLDAYERRRAADIAARVRVIDLFNRVTRSGSSELQALRLAGLKAVHGMAPLRQAVMRAGMGPRGAG